MRWREIWTQHRDFGVHSRLKFSRRSWSKVVSCCWGNHKTLLDLDIFHSLIEIEACTAIVQSNTNCFAFYLLSQKLGENDFSWTRFWLRRCLCWLWRTLPRGGYGNSTSNRYATTVWLLMKVPSLHFSSFYTVLHRIRRRWTFDCSLHVRKWFCFRKVWFSLHQHHAYDYNVTYHLSPHRQWHGPSVQQQYSDFRPIRPETNDQRTVL